MLKNRAQNSAFVSVTVNILFGAYNILLGATTLSWWMLTIGTYYIVLSAMRIAVLKTKNSGKSIQRISGIMLVCMTLPLAGTVVLASIKDRGIHYHEIVMITIAVFAFTKITLASVNLAKSRKSNAEKVRTLRNISFADAFVSIFSLQRSMLVSFEGMTATGIRIMNIATGSGVCVVVFALGVNLLWKSRRQIA